jgi:surface protein
MEYMFTDSEFNGDISKWNISNVTDMTAMFEGSEFNRDLSSWNVDSIL